MTLRRAPATVSSEWLSWTRRWSTLGCSSPCHRNSSTLTFMASPTRYATNPDYPLAARRRIESFGSEICCSRKRKHGRHWAEASALDPAGVPAVTGSDYPEAFRALVERGQRQRLGDALGLKNFGVNLTRPAARVRLIVAPLAQPAE